MANIAQDLTVADIERAKRLLEDSVADAVRDALSAFQSRTGFTPSAIDVNLARVETFGQQRPDYILDNVRAEIRIT
jgi:hypothetical protein